MATDYNLADPLRYGAVRRRNAEQDRRQRLANRGIDEAMDFARTRPMIITSDEGQVPDSAFRNRNSFANVEGNVDTVPGRAQGNSMQRRASRTDVARGGSVSAPNISSNPQSERERKQRVSELDSALFDLRARGGGLNMASKRRLYGDLIGEKNRLTSTAYQGQTERDIARARMQSDVAQTNASLAERAAYRRDAAQMFDTEASDRRFEFDTNRSDELRKLNAPLTEKERLEMAKLVAEQAREADKYELERGGSFEGVLQKRIDAMREQGVPEDRIAVEAAKSAQALGVDPYAAPTSASGADETKERVANLYNGDRGIGSLVNVWGLMDEAAPNSFLTAGNLDPQAIRDFDSVRTEPTSLLRRALTGAPRYRFEVTNSATGKPEARYSDDEQLFQDVRALRRRGGSNK